MVYCKEVNIHRFHAHTQGSCRLCCRTARQNKDPPAALQSTASYSTDGKYHLKPGLVPKTIQVIYWVEDTAESQATSFLSYVSSQKISSAPLPFHWAMEGCCQDNPGLVNPSRVLNRWISLKIFSFFHTQIFLINSYASSPVSQPETNPNCVSIWTYKWWGYIKLHVVFTNAALFHLSTMPPLLLWPLLMFLWTHVSDANFKTSPTTNTVSDILKKLPHRNDITHILV